MAPRQRDGKHNPVVFAGGTDGTAVQANDFLRDCKAEPGPAACAGTGGVEAEELLENAVELFPRNGGAAVFKKRQIPLLKS